MANEIRNAKSLIRRHLLGTTAIQALVESRVLGQHASAADAGSVPHPSIVIEMDGGSSLYNGIIQLMRFQLTCYSRTSQDEASRLYDLCYTALQAECLSDTNLDMSLLCQESTRPTEGWNRDTMAWFTVGDFLASGAG